MRCPYCHVDGKDRVIDSRPVEDGHAIRRRRVCENCSRRYTTYERIEETVRLQVVKKDGTRVPFDRNKLLAGVQKACYKRPVPGEKVAKIVDAVEEEISRTGQREVESRLIGEIVIGASAYLGTLLVFFSKRVAGIKGFVQQTARLRGVSGARA